MSKENHIDYVQKFKNEFKNNILEENCICGDMTFIILENNLKYLTFIGKVNYGFYIQWREWTKNLDSQVSNKHRLLKPSIIRLDREGELLKSKFPTEEYYLNGIKYSKKDFYNHPLNKELIIARRFKLV